MPLSIQEQNELLRSKGWDPNIFEMDEATGDVYKRDTPLNPEPTLTPPAIPSSKPSFIESTGRATATSAFPSLAAVAGGALSAEALPLAHVAPPYSEIGAGLIGALATGFGASKLQSAVVPQDIQQKIFTRPEDVQEHPVGTEVGGFLPLLATGNPVKSLASLGRASKGLLGRVSWDALSNAEKEGILNVIKGSAINVGTQGGVNIAQQLAGEEPFSGTELAAQMAGGLLFNEPTKLAQKYLKMRPSFSGVPTDAELMARNRETYRQPEIPPLTLPEVAPETYGVHNLPEVPKTRLSESGVRKLEEKQYGLPGLKHRDEPILQERENERIAGEGGVAQELEAEKQSLLQERQSLENQALAKENEELKARLTGEAPPIKGKGTEYGQRREYGEGGPGPYKYSEVPRTTTETPVQQTFSAAEKEISEVLARRGIRTGQYRVQILDAKGNPVLGPKTKLPIAGRATYPLRKVDYGINAGADTGFHEPFHIYLEDLARSSNPKDRELVTKAFREIGRPDITAEEYVKLNDAWRNGDNEAHAKFIDAEEALADNAGLAGANRALKEGKFEGFTKDFLSRFGIGQEPAQRQLSARLHYEAPYGSRKEITDATRLQQNKGSVQPQRQEGIGEREGNETSPGNRILSEGGEEKGKGEGEELSKFGERRPPKKELGEMTEDELTQKIYTAKDRLNRARTDNEKDWLHGVIKAHEDELKSREDKSKLSEESKQEENNFVRLSNTTGGKIITEGRRIAHFDRNKAEKDLELANIKGDTFDAAVNTLVNAYYNKRPEKISKESRDFLTRKAEDAINGNQHLENLFRSVIGDEQYDGIKDFWETKTREAEEGITEADRNLREREKELEFKRNEYNSFFNKENYSKQSEESKLPEGFGEGPGIPKQPEETRKSSKIQTGIQNQLTESSFNAAKGVLQTGKKLKASEQYVEDQIRNIWTKIPEDTHTDSPDKNFYKALAVKAIVDEHPEAESLLRKEIGDELVDEVKNDYEHLNKEYEDILPGLQRERVEASTKATSKIDELNALYHPSKQSEESKFNPEDLKISARAFISPEGKIINGKPGEYHFQIPKRVFPDLKVEEGNTHENTLVENMGYAKILTTGNYYFVDSFKPLTRTQENTLRDAAIFNKKGLVIDNKRILDSPEEDKFSESSKLKEEDLSDISKSRPNLNVFTSITDKIAAGKNSPTHQKVSKGLTNFFNESDYLKGQYGNTFPVLFDKFSPQEVQNVYKNRYERDNKITETKTLSPREKELDTQWQALQDKPKTDAAKIGFTEKRGESYSTGGLKKEGILPNIMDPKVLYELDTQPNSIEAKKYKRIWSEWLTSKGVSPEDARKMVTDWETGRREYGEIGSLAFAAARRPEGYGLPWELIDKEPARAMVRFGNRAARDIAWFKHIQNNPELRYALGVKDQFGEKPKEIKGIDYIGTEKDVQDALQFVYGKHIYSEYPRIEAFSRFAGNLVMGPGTAIRNLATIPSQLASFDVGMKDIFKGLTNIVTSRQRAIESNAIRLNPAEFEKVGEMDHPDKVIATLNKLSNLLRKIQGRNASDNFEGNLIYAIGEEWAKTKHIEALAGDKNAQKLLERVTGETYNPSAEPDISRAAKGFVNIIRGTYGPQGLPKWALTGNIAPFAALNRYAIERWNNVYKDTIIPLKNGNPLPFLKYTLASILSGAGVEELNKLISGKKGSDTDIKETLAAYAEKEDPEIFAHKVIALAQLSSYSGIVGDLAKTISNARQGKSLEYSNPLSFPLYTLATETFAQNFAEAMGAIKQGEDPINIFTELIKTVGVQATQAGRYLNTRLSPEETARKEEFADYRKYREATGKVEPEASISRGNEFQNLEAKKFKRTTDINEAVELLPNLIQRAFEKAGNDPYKLKSELRKLKENNVQIFPAPENEPIEFYNYLNYLRSSQGEEKASDRLSTFLVKRATNKIKGKLVP